MSEIPSDQHITYQLQFRKCGKTSCSTCRNTQGHGPYWYAYWREGSRLKSGYVGKIHPSQQQGLPLPAVVRKKRAAAALAQTVPTTPTVPATPAAEILQDGFATTPVLI